MGLINGMVDIFDVNNLKRMKRVIIQQKEKMTIRYFNKLSNYNEIGIGTNAGLYFAFIHESVVDVN